MFLRRAYPRESFLPSSAFPSVSCANPSCDERPDGSLPAFAWDECFLSAPSLSIPLQNGVCFFRHPFPAPLSVLLADCFPFGRRYGVAMFRLYAPIG